MAAGVVIEGLDVTTVIKTALPERDPLTSGNPKRLKASHDDSYLLLCIFDLLGTLILWYCESIKIKIISIKKP